MLLVKSALKQLPADIRDRGYDAILGYLWMMGDADGEGERADLFNDILRRQYEHRKYPSFILRCDYNQLQGWTRAESLFPGTTRFVWQVMLQQVLRWTGQGAGHVGMPSHALCRKLEHTSFPAAQGDDGGRV